MRTERPSPYGGWRDHSIDGLYQLKPKFCPFLAWSNSWWFGKPSRSEQVQEDKKSIEQLAELTICSKWPCCRIFPILFSDLRYQRRMKLIKVGMIRVLKTMFLFHWPPRFPEFDSRVGEVFSWRLSKEELIKSLMGISDCRKGSISAGLEELWLFMVVCQSAVGTFSRIESRSCYFHLKRFHRKINRKKI